jgi:tellurite resistance protein
MRLAHLPVALFSMSLGLFGLTLVWQQASVVLGASALIGTGLLLLATAVFTLVGVSYGLKLVRYPDAVIAELRHPIKSSFFATVSASLILLGTALQARLPDLALIIWALGAATHLLFTVMIINRWMHHEQFEVTHINPAWFIPAVGNILIPIAGVDFGYPSVAWFFFSIGVVFWLVLLSIIFYRIFFHAPLPERLLPTLFILIAPPAAGFIAYTQLISGVDSFARVQVNIALFFTLLLVSQLRRFAALSFSLSFWAYSFPLAAMSVAMMRYYQLTDVTWTLIVGGLLTALTSAVITWLAALTIKAAKHQQICVPEG